MSSAGALSVSLIIPALNEERTIAGVVEPAIASGVFREVTLVDDGSRDRTAEVFRGAFERARREAVPGTVLPYSRVVVHPSTMGKAVSMRDGVMADSSDIVMFLDGDLLGLTREHIHAMLAPILERGKYRASLGVFVGGRAATTVAQKIAPFISGQRACYRRDLMGFRRWEHVGFGIETALNRYFQEKGIFVRVVELPGLSQRMKEEKRGLLPGFAARMKMYWEILRTWLTSKFTRYSGER